MPTTPEMDPKVMRRGKVRPHSSRSSCTANKMIASGAKRKKSDCRASLDAIANVWGSRVHQRRRKCPQRYLDLESKPRDPPAVARYRVAPRKNEADCTCEPIFLSPVLAPECQKRTAAADDDCGVQDCQGMHSPRDQPPARNSSTNVMRSLKKGARTR